MRLKRLPLLRKCCIFEESSDYFLIFDKVGVLLSDEASQVSVEPCFSELISMRVGRGRERHSIM